MSKRPPGLFITATDTDAGKTYVTAMVARALVAAGRRVGVYKPAASGCRVEAGELISDDAQALWNAAGRPGTLEEVCPQRFAAPLAPNLAARQVGQRVDGQLLRAGLDPWLQRSEIVLVEGAGGLLSPMSDDDYVADVAAAFGFPLLVVVPNVLGCINHTLLTLSAAQTFAGGLPVAGVVLNRPRAASDSAADELLYSINRIELAARAGVPILAEVLHGATTFEPAVDWFALASQG